jgi:hypothetical protein
MLFLLAALFVVFGSTIADAREGGGAIPGSMGVVPYWDNTGTNRTLFRIVNTGGTFPVGAPAFAQVNVPVHLIFVTGEEFGCSEWNSVLRLTKGEATQINTKSFIQSSTIKSQKGFAVLYVGDNTQKWCWDHIVIDWWIIDTDSGNIIGDPALMSKGATFNQCAVDCTEPFWTGFAVAGGEVGTPLGAGGPGDDEMLRFCGANNTNCTYNGDAAEYRGGLYPSEFIVQYNTRFRKLGFLPAGQNKTDATTLIFLPFPEENGGSCSTFDATSQDKLCYCYDLVIWNAFETQNSLPDRRACCWTMESLSDVTDTVSTQKSFFSDNGQRANYGWLDIFPETSCETDIEFQIGGFERTSQAIMYQLEGVRPFGEWSLYTAHESTQTSP